MPQLEDFYKSEVAPKLMERFDYTNVMEVPRVEKVVLSIGLGEAIQNPKAVEMATADLAAISGQRPVVTRAKHSISSFRLRAGMPIGVMVTLRGKRMYYFLDKLMNIVLPRIRDFQGVTDSSFDGRGNYTLGLTDQTIFPEIEYEKVDKLRGLAISIVTTAGSDDEGRALLEELGMPFTKERITYGKQS
jgi:large subunit ribosomal protein L5